MSQRVAGPVRTQHKDVRRPRLHVRSNRVQLLLVHHLDEVLLARLDRLLHLSHDRLVMMRELPGSALVKGNQENRLQVARSRVSVRVVHL